MGCGNSCSFFSCVQREIILLFTFLLEFHRFLWQHQLPYTPLQQPLQKTASPDTCACPHGVWDLRLGATWSVVGKVQAHTLEKWQTVEEQPESWAPGLSPALGGSFHPFGNGYMSLSVSVTFRAQGQLWSSVDMSLGMCMVSSVFLDVV